MSVRDCFYRNRELVKCSYLDLWGRADAKGATSSEWMFLSKRQVLAISPHRFWVSTYRPRASVLKTPGT